MTLPSPASPAGPETDPVLATEPGFDLRPITPGLFELRIWGKFPPKWLANLCGGLTAHQANIHRGQANKLTPTLWQATLEFSGETADFTPQHIPYLRMAQRSGGGLAGEIELDSYVLERRDDALYLQVRGVDRLGFLEALLKLFALYALFPAEVRLDTSAGLAEDLFWLKGMGGTSPSEASMAGLRTELDRRLR